MDESPGEPGTDFWGDDLASGKGRRESALAALRSGWHDLRRLPLLATTTWVIVSIATLSILSAPLLSQLTRSAETHVIEGSELVIAVDPVSDELMGRIDETIGVGMLRPSTEEDLEAVGSGWNSLAARYTIIPSGEVDLDTLQSRLSASFPEIVGIAHTVGIESDRAIQLLEVTLPWLAAMLSLAGLVMILYLGLMIGRIRADEAETMGLIGATPFDTWLRLGSVAFIPTVFAVLTTSALALTFAPSLATRLLSRQAAAQISSGALLGTVALLIVGAAVISGISGLLGMRMGRRPA